MTLDSSLAYCIVLFCTLNNVLFCTLYCPLYKLCTYSYSTSMFVYGYAFVRERTVTEISNSSSYSPIVARNENSARVEVPPLHTLECLRVPFTLRAHVRSSNSPLLQSPVSSPIRSSARFVGVQCSRLSA